MAILPRQSIRCNDGLYDDDDDCDGAWSEYGRWVVLGVIILGAFLLFVAFSCITARRRRRMGNTPFLGTGWAAGSTPPGHAPAQYTGGQQYFANNNNNAPPPVYSPPQGQYNQGYNANQGYFGGQQQGVELQQPQNTYARGGEPVYSPPAGPPPDKREGDGVVR